MFINVNQTLRYDSALEGNYKINKRTSRLSIFFIDSNLSILSQSFLFGPLNTSRKLRVSWFGLICVNKTEEATRGVLCKKVFLEISHNSQENTWVSLFRVLFFSETLAQVFSCEFCEISKKTFLQSTSGRLLLTKPTFCMYCSHSLHGQAAQGSSLILIS